MQIGMLKRISQSERVEFSGQRRQGGAGNQSQKDRFGNQNAFRKGLTFAIGLAMCLACPRWVQGQQQTASITGRVTDSSGASVPGATITVSNVSRGIKRAVTADGQGEYVVALLPPAGDYSLTITKAGFKTVSRNGLVLQTAQVAEIDTSLSVGNVDQSVTVTSAEPLLDTQTSSVGQVISEKAITGLALNGRSTFRLIQLTPGITFNQGASQFGDVPANTTFDVISQSMAAEHRATMF